MNPMGFVRPEGIMPNSIGDGTDFRTEDVYDGGAGLQAAPSRDDEPSIAMARDLSSGGVFIETSERLAEGTKVGLAFWVPSGRSLTPVVALGHVQRRMKNGNGVGFDRVICGFDAMVAFIRDWQPRPAGGESPSPLDRRTAARVDVKLPVLWLTATRGSAATLSDPTAILERMLGATGRGAPGSLGGVTPEHSLGMEGQLDILPLEELFEHLARQSASGRLEIEFADEPTTARLVLVDGQVVNSVLGLLDGQAALWQLLPRPGKRFTFRMDATLDAWSTSTERPATAIVAQGRRLLERGLLERIDVTDAEACEAFEQVRVQLDHGSWFTDVGDFAATVESIEESLADLQLASLTGEDMDAFVEAEEVGPSGDEAVDAEPADPAGADADADEAASVQLVEWGASPVERLFTLMRRAQVAGGVEIGLREIQIATRSGRTLASTLVDRQRRHRLSRLAYRVVRVTIDEIEMAVVSLPHRRILVCLFAASPTPEVLRRWITPALEQAWAV
jgi:hypothetical protein